MATPTASGTTTATGAPQSLTDTTANKYFTFKIDTSAMNTANGDILVLTIYDVVLPGGTYQIYKQETYTGTQTEPIKFLAPLWITEKIKVTIHQTAGTPLKAYPWVLLES